MRLCIVLFSLCSLLFYSCKDEYTLCTLSKQVNFTGTFYQRQGNNDIAVPAPNLSVYILGNGSPVISNQVNAASFSLPLNQLKDSAQYVLTLMNAQADTLTVVYSSQVSNLSPECGQITYHNISRSYVTGHTIDSVKIIRPLINTEPATNVKVYF